MDILYIVAGLIIVLLIVVLFLRKNKTTQTRYVDNKNIANRIKPTPVNTISATSNQNPADSVTQFDSIAVAQRFMDQQRYDKAIETLERGLIDTPNDTKLLLKLLSIFIETNEPNRFNSTYDTIKTYGDVNAIEQADNLKDLLEPYQTLKVSNDLETIPFENAASPFASDSRSDDMSLDFEMPVTGDANNTVTNSENFELTLADLETVDVDTNTIEPSFNTENTILNDTSAFDGFELTLSEEDEAKPASKNELNIIEDDFVLEFDNAESDNFVQTANHSESLIEEEEGQNLSFETVDLTDIDNGSFDPKISDSSDESKDSIEPSSDLLPIDNDFSFDIAPVTDDDSFDFSEIINESEPTLIEKESPLIEKESPLIEENSPLVESSFDTSSYTPSALTPVSIDNENLASQDDVIPDASFATQFAADFDFVNILDNQQVTLDLAEQYLQLGEYDSAKRLLSEVIEQGNDEQQQQAQELLSRTT